MSFDVGASSEYPDRATSVMQRYHVHFAVKRELATN